MSVRHLSVLGTMFVCAVATAGDLYPPPGAVAPTMLPLDRIEPRVCVNDLAGSADAMHVITQPGVYFVGADIVAGPGQGAIVIDLPPGLDGQVVLDLGGFSLTGSGVGGASGLRVLQAGPIYVLSPNVVRIENFGGHGIEVLGASQVSIDGVNIADCAGDGVHVAGVGDVSIGAVEIRACAGNGVAVIGADYMAINEKGLPPRRHPKKKNNQSRIVGVGGHGVHVSDCDDTSIDDFDIRLAGGDGVRIEHGAPGGAMRVSIADGGVTAVGGNGVTVLAGQTTASAIIRRVHVKESIDALYAQDLRTIELIDWRDEDSDDDGIDIVAGVGQSPGGKRYTISGVVSERALGSGITVTDTGAGGGSVSISDARAVGTGDTVIIAKMQRVELARVVADGGGIAPTGIEIDAIDATLHDVHTTRALGPGASVVVSGALTVDGFIAERNVGGGFHGAGTGSGKVRMLDFRMSDNGAGGVGGATADGAVFFEFDTLVLHNGESSGNTGSGLRIIDLNRDGRLDLVTCSANDAGGVSVESPSGVGAGRFVISNSVFGSNGADGLFLEATTGGQVVDCTATNNTGWGIRVLGSNHLIQRNACLGNFGGSLFAAAPGNIVGPMVNELSVGANTNPAANYE